MQEFAGVAEAAEAGLFVVFADVGGEVCDCYGADVGGGFDGADGAGGGGVRVFGDVGLVVGGAFVCAVGRRRIVFVVVCFWRAGAGCAQKGFCVRGGFFVEPVGGLGCIVSF